jgi:hypothetical protein
VTDLLNSAAVGGWTPGVAAVELSGPVESAGSGVQGEPATAQPAAHEAPGDEQHGTAASPPARSTCARQSTGGTHSARSLAAAVSPTETGSGSGLPLRQLISPEAALEAALLTREYRRNPAAFK